MVKNELNGEVDLEALRRTSLPSFYERYIQIQLYRLLLLISVLIAWQLASGRFVPVNWVASPVMVAQQGWQWIHNGILFYHFKITLLEMIVGSVIGTVMAVMTGFLLSFSKTLSGALMPYISAIYCIPRIALAPLFVMWFGIGINSKIALVIIVVYFLVFIQSFVGARDVESLYLEVLKIMGATRWDIFRKVLLPHSTGWIFVGLRLALPRALIAAVVGEIISSNRGLGYLLEQAGANFDVAGVLAAVSVLAIVGVTLNMLLTKLETVTSKYRFLG